MLIFYFNEYLVCVLLIWFAGEDFKFCSREFLDDWARTWGPGYSSKFARVTFFPLLTGPRCWSIVISRTDVERTDHLLLLVETSEIILIITESSTDILLNWWTCSVRLWQTCLVHKPFYGKEFGIPNWVHGRSFYGTAKGIFSYVGCIDLYVCHTSSYFCIANDMHFDDSEDPESLSKDLENMEGTRLNWYHHLFSTRPFKSLPKEVVNWFVNMDLCSFNIIIVICQDSKHSNKPGCKREGTFCFWSVGDFFRCQVCDLVWLISYLEFWLEILWTLSRQCVTSSLFAEPKTLPEERLVKSHSQKKNPTILFSRSYPSLHGLTATWSRTRFPTTAVKWMGMGSTLLSRMNTVCI